MINQLANEIGLLAYVISKLKMAEIFKFWTSVKDAGRRQEKRQDGTRSTFSSCFSSKFSGKLPLPGNLLSCFPPCAAGFSYSGIYGLT